MVASDRGSLKMKLISSERYRACASRFLLSAGGVGYERSLLNTSLLPRQSKELPEDHSFIYMIDLKMHQNLRRKKP
jgi:hypothetical protein